MAGLLQRRAGTTSRRPERVGLGWGKASSNCGHRYSGPQPTRSPLEAKAGLKAPGKMPEKRLAPRKSGREWGKWGAGGKWMEMEDVLGAQWENGTNLETPKNAVPQWATFCENR